MADKENIRGVNFGNWLVLEEWMHDAMFAGTDAEDEVWLNRLLPREELKKRYKEHRDTYITEEDFRTVAEHGINLVRIPVPFFLFDDRPPYVGCVEYLDQAFDWAERYGLQIMVDLHTVPGSQNGYDNGGLTGVCKWCGDKEEVKFALSVLERIAARYGKRKGLFGIEVLNEPISWIVYATAPSTGRARDKEEAKGSGYVPLAFLKQFYREAYVRIRRYMPADKTIVFHDGFRISSWKDFFVREGMENVMLDTHIYIFAMETFVPIKAEWVYRLFVAWNKRLIQRAARYTPVVVGEWCMENKLALYEARRKRRSEEEGRQISRRLYQKVGAMQLDAWSTSAGWIYWSYQLSPDVDGPMRIDKNGKSWEAWALSRVWKHGWWPSDGKERTK